VGFSQPLVRAIASFLWTRLNNSVGLQTSCSSGGAAACSSDRGVYWRLLLEYCAPRLIEVHCGTGLFLIPMVLPAAIVVASSGRGDLHARPISRCSASSAAWA